MITRVLTKGSTCLKLKFTGTDLEDLAGGQPRTQAHFTDVGIKQYLGTWLAGGRNLEMRLNRNKELVQIKIEVMLREISPKPAKKQEGNKKMRLYDCFETEKNIGGPK